jgi:hypothetical protein
LDTISEIHPRQHFPETANNGFSSSDRLARSTVRPSSFARGGEKRGGIAISHPVQNAMASLGTFSLVDSVIEFPAAETSCPRLMWISFPSSTSPKVSGSRS